MQIVIANNKQVLKLKPKGETQRFTAEITNATQINNENFSNKIALDFKLTHIGTTTNNTYRYTLRVNNRYFLDNNGFAIQKLNKIQQLAKKIASLNDELEIEISKNHQLIKVLNTSEIRSKWNTLKPEVLKDFPDLSAMASDFDWQLQEQNIQQIFLDDNFYNFFFPNIFNLNFEAHNPLVNNKTISNGVGEINIPIIEKKYIKYEDRALTKAIVLTEAEIDVNNKQFPLAKLNAFIGDLDTIAGNNYDLDFNYKGKYTVNSEIGIINKGELTYFFSVNDVYTNKTTIHFNLESYE